MDVADDIAYSTYDLEDTFKSTLLTPLGFWLQTRDTQLMRDIADRISKKIPLFYDAPSDFDEAQAMTIMYDFFKKWFNIQFDDEKIAAQYGAADETSRGAYFAAELSQMSRQLATDGYVRTEFTSGLISKALDELEIVPSDIHPALTRVRLTLSKFKEIELLKSLNYSVIISSSLMRAIEYKGRKIVTELFEILSTPLEANCFRRTSRVCMMRSASLHLRREWFAISCLV